MEHDRVMDPARRLYSQDVLGVEHDLIEMASRAESMVGQAVEALSALDTAQAMSVIRRDDEIDNLEIAIEAKCLKLLAFQHPIASDFRVIGTALKMITDVERVGDLAVDIAKAALKIEKELGDASYVDIPRMASLARGMLRQAIEAFVRRDLELVNAVCKADDEVDDLYRQLRGQIHEVMRTEPDQVVSASWLLLAIHHIERIADHAVNVAERVAFMVTGDFEQLAATHHPDSVEP